MDFIYTDEQDALRDAVRGLLTKSYSDFGKRRQATKQEPGYSEELWGRLAELGALGLPFSEEDGGAGAGWVETAVVAQEVGRVIAPEPYAVTVGLAGSLLAAVGTDEQRAELLGGLASGETLVAVAHEEPGRRWKPSASDVKASQDGDSWTVDGVKEPVLQGARADVLVVSAVLPEGGTGLFLVDGGAEGVEREGYATFEGGRAARVTFTAARATPLGEAGVNRTAAVATALDTARILVANEALGIMEVALTMTTDYLKSRKQFGVTLNTFQALTFRAADLYVSLQLATSIVQWATMVLEAGDPAAISAAARRTTLMVSRASRHIGQEAIQLHGGIGMTAEYAVGSYTSRLTAIDHLFGDGSFAVGALADGVGGYDALDPLA